MQLTTKTYCSKTKKKGGKEFDESRVIMWDTTNVDLCKPGAAEGQQLTYSSYYGGNVAKSGVNNMLCDWRGTHELWTRAATDSDYFIKSKILEQQQHFIEQHNNIHENVVWTNILDRGFKVAKEALETSGQQVLQPMNSTTGRSFTTTETLFLSSIATIPAGNERTVRAMKCNGYLSNGLRSNESVVRLSDVWLVYGFMTNFLTASDL
jgi:hypothetical protein